MHLKRLEIEGFKTFAKHTILEFGPGITAIVGPNGSGKSNISDAIRWVLGEQSYTTLRCKRSEELLFSGSERHAPGSRAEVSLTIDNSDRLLPLDFSEVTITRRVGRSGSNEYLINQKKVRLRDIQEATEPLGSSYTIVNQGLVDMALTLRPEERRRLFEHAAELGTFETRRNEAEQRLHETEANMQRTADLLSEIEPRLRSLKRQATLARQHRELSEELRRLLAIFYTRQWQTVCANLAAAEQHLAALRAELEQTRQQQEAAAAELHALRESLRGQREQLATLQQQRGLIQSRMEEAKRTHALARERLTALQQRGEELQQTRADLEQSHAETARQHAAVLAELATLEADLTGQRSRLQACTEEAAAYEEARRARERELSEAQDAALTARTAAAEQRSRITHLGAQRERLLQDQAKLDETLQQAQEQLAAAQEQAAAARAAAAAAETALQEAAQGETAAQEQLEALRQERRATDDELAALQRARSDAQARLDTLNRLASSYTGTFPGVKAAMQWAERSGRVGFVLVSSVVRVPAELETAIEVALGARLQHIVVESWQDAEDAIAELKRSRAGRATFLPLDTIGRNRSQSRRAAGVPGEEDYTGSPFSTHEPVQGIAADLVGYDQHYASVVQHLLGRTLIVRDLPTARQELTRLSGGWMIITLAGEQVSSGGAVTGGSQTRESGTLQRERELRELPEQVQQTQEAVANAEARCHALDERLTGARQALRAAELRHQEAARSSAALRAEQEQAQQHAAHAEQELTWRRERREVVARDLETLAGQETALLEQCSAAEARAATAQEHLDRLRERQQSETDTDREMQEKLAALRAAVARSEAQVRAQQSLAASHLQTLERIERQQVETAARFDALNNDRASNEAACSQADTTCNTLQDEQEALQSRMDSVEEALRQGDEQQHAMEQEEKQATAVLLEKETACNRADLDVQRAQDRREHVLARAEADEIALQGEQSVSDDSPQDAPADLSAEIERLRERLKRLGAINPLALEEYEELSERHGFMKTQLDDLHQAKATLRELIAELETAMHNRFLQTFNAVALEFGRYFTRLFGGGTARLQLVSRGSVISSSNGDNPAAGVPRDAPLGIEIVARPPGKRQHNLLLLSGGERALTASALLFAILSVNPSPFCVMDEVDAALDEANVGRFREALSDLTQQTQFILISHNRGTMEAAETFYGVSMGDDGVSRVLSLKVEAVLEQPAEEVLAHGP